MVKAHRTLALVVSAAILAIGVLGFIVRPIWRHGASEDQGRSTKPEHSQGAIPNRLGAIVPMELPRVAGV